jgi:hypothetical protein
MTGEMIERVAKHIGAAKFKLRPGTSNSDTNVIWIALQEEAVEALIAVREPTEEMLQKGLEEFASASREELLRAWRAMIDKVLR